MSIELIQNNRKVRFKKSDGSIIFISACKWKDLDILQTYIAELLKQLIDFNGYPGEILLPSNTSFWSIIDSVCKILVTDSTPITKEDFLELENYDQAIIKFFLTSTINIDSTGALEGKAGPSYLCVINGLDFFTRLNKVLQTKEKV